MLQLHLDRHDYHIIYLDEFAISSRNFAQYSWSQNGSKGYLARRHSSFSMSFIVAFWSRRIWGALGSAGAINSNVMRKFTDGVLWSEVTAFGVDRSKIVFVMDNASIHKFKIMKDYIKEHRLFVLTTTPYWSWLNPTEKVIWWIKKKVQKYLGEGR